ncbi:hypothetical protein [Haloferax elongans]|nr:hypothetical protein [Haloferax elongans]
MQESKLNALTFALPLIPAFVLASWLDVAKAGLEILQIILGLF